MKILLRITGWVVSGITQLSGKTEPWQARLENKYNVYEDEVAPLNLCIKVEVPEN